jgi:RNA polymerase sigma factor (sigma-70 family)
MASGATGTRQDYQNQLEHLLRFGVVGDLSDGQLVQRFRSGRDSAGQAAIAALVERHGPMVLGVCREVLGNPHDADDAFQATFLVLARGARALRKADSVASWLHGVALRVAVRARKQAARRRHHEKLAAAMKLVQVDPAEHAPQLFPELHEAIARLPGRYREPVVLYYLEGLSTEETALRLGCPHGTVLSRLSRARGRLHRQLARRGIALAAGVLALGVVPRAMAAVPGALIGTTIQAALDFSIGKTVKVTQAAATLAKGVIHTMAISRLMVLGSIVLAGGLVWGGVQTFGQSGKSVGEPQAPGAGSDVDDRHSALNRSIEKLQSELDESGRRFAEMHNELRAIRGELRDLTLRHPTTPAKAAAVRLYAAINTEYGKAANQLAEALKQHPPKPSRDVGWNYQLHMLDLIDGSVTLVADEPLPQQYCSGLGKWSHDGTRIVFDTTGSEWPVGKLMAIEVKDGRPVFSELGPGNNPAWSPNDRQIAFVRHPTPGREGESGAVWLMHADGSDSRRVADFGAPSWSPDGTGFLINSYSLPTKSSVFNLETRESGVLQVAGHQVFSWPSWARPDTLVSALATDGQPDTIALLDVHNPAEAKIIEVLWKRSKDLDVIPRWPVYLPASRRLFFVGEEPKQRMIYHLQRGEPQSLKRLDVVEYLRPGAAAQQLAGLSFSPGGRYLLFNANRPERP